MIQQHSERKRPNLCRGKESADHWIVYSLPWVRPERMDQIWRSDLGLRQNEWLLRKMRRNWTVAFLLPSDELSTTTLTKSWELSACELERIRFYRITNNSALSHQRYFCSWFLYNSSMLKISFVFEYLQDIVQWLWWTSLKLSGALLSLVCQDRKQPQQLTISTNYTIDWEYKLLLVTISRFLLII